VTGQCNREVLFPWLVYIPTLGYITVYELLLLKEKLSATFKDKFTKLNGYVDISSHLRYYSGCLEWFTSLSSYSQGTVFTSHEHRHVLQFGVL